MAGLDANPNPPPAPEGGRRGDMNRGDGDSWREAADRRGRANSRTRKKRARETETTQTGTVGTELFLGGKDEDGGRERN